MSDRTVPAAAFDALAAALAKVVHVNDSIEGALGELYGMSEADVEMCRRILHGERADDLFGPLGHWTERTGGDT